MSEQNLYWSDTLSDQLEKIVICTEYMRSAGSYLIMIIYPGYVWGRNSLIITIPLVWVYSEAITSYHHRGSHVIPQWNCIPGHGIARATDKINTSSSLLHSATWDPPKRHSRMTAIQLAIFLEKRQWLGTLLSHSKMQRIIKVHGKHTEEEKLKDTWSLCTRIALKRHIHGTIF